MQSEARVDRRRSRKPRVNKVVVKREVWHQESANDGDGRQHPAPSLNYQYDFESRGGQKAGAPRRRMLVLTPRTRYDSIAHKVRAIPAQIMTDEHNGHTGSISKLARLENVKQQRVLSAHARLQMSNSMADKAGMEASRGLKTREEGVNCMHAINDVFRRAALWRNDTSGRDPEHIYLESSAAAPRPGHDDSGRKKQARPDARMSSAQLTRATSAPNFTGGSKAQVLQAVAVKLEEFRNDGYKRDQLMHRVRQRKEEQRKQGMGERVLQNRKAVSQYHPQTQEDLRQQRAAQQEVRHQFAVAKRERLDKAYGDKQAIKLAKLQSKFSAEEQERRIKAKRMLQGVSTMMQKRWLVLLVVIPTLNAFKTKLHVQKAAFIKRDTMAFLGDAIRGSYRGVLTLRMGAERTNAKKVFAKAIRGWSMRLKIQRRKRAAAAVLAFMMFANHTKSMKASLTNSTFRGKTVKIQKWWRQRIVVAKAHRGMLAMLLRATGKKMQSKEEPRSKGSKKPKNQKGKKPAKGKKGQAKKDEDDDATEVDSEDNYNWEGFGQFLQIPDTIPNLNSPPLLPTLTLSFNAMPDVVMACIVTKLNHHLRARMQKAIVVHREKLQAYYEKNQEKIVLADLKRSMGQIPQPLPPEPPFPRFMLVPPRTELQAFIRLVLSSMAAFKKRKLTESFSQAVTRQSVNRTSVTSDLIAGLSSAARASMDVETISE